MKIVHINNIDTGGAATVARRLIRAQRAQGWESFLLSPQKTADSDDIRTFDPRPNQVIRDECRRRGLLYYEYQGSHALIRHPDVVDADIIHLHNLHGGYFNPFSLLLLCARKPVVWTLHDMQPLTGRCTHAAACGQWDDGCTSCRAFPESSDQAVKSIGRLWLDKRHIYTHTVLWPAAPSQWMRTNMEHSILSRHPAMLIPNGVDAQVFSPDKRMDIRKRYAIADNAVVIGAAARGGVLNQRIKGGDLVVEVLRALKSQGIPAVYLDIGGDGSAGGDDCVKVPYIRDETELAAHLAAIDLYVMSSREENCPLSVLEAMSCGVPVAAFDTGGVGELVRHDLEGLLAVPAKTAGLIKHVVTLARDAQQRARMGVRARDRVRTCFDIRTMHRRYEALYDRAADDFNRRRLTLPRFRIKDVPGVIRTGLFLRGACETDASDACGFTDPEILVRQGLADDDTRDLQFMNAVDELIRAGKDDIAGQVIREGTGQWRDNPIVMKFLAGLLERMKKTYQSGQSGQLHFQNGGDR